VSGRLGFVELARAVAKQGRAISSLITSTSVLLEHVAEEQLDHARPKEATT